MFSNDGIMAWIIGKQQDRATTLQLLLQLLNGVPANPDLPGRIVAIYR